MYPPSRHLPCQPQHLFSYSSIHWEINQEMMRARGVRGLWGGGLGKGDITLSYSSWAANSLLLLCLLVTSQRERARVSETPMHVLCPVGCGPLD